MLHFFQAKLWDIRAARPPEASRAAARALPGSYYDYRHGMLHNMMRRNDTNGEGIFLVVFFFSLFF